MKIDGIEEKIDEERKGEIEGLEIIIGIKRIGNEGRKIERVMEERIGKKNWGIGRDIEMRRIERGIEKYEWKVKLKKIFWFKINILKSFFNKWIEIWKDINGM